MGMVHDSFPFFTIIAVFAFGFGVAYTALLPSPSLLGDPHWAEESWSRTFWSLVGYIYTPDALKVHEAPQMVRILMPLMLFFYTFLVGIMVLNLMIAQADAAPRLPSAHSLHAHGRSS
eukprot:7042073-Prymnesium_polylepis.1